MGLTSKNGEIKNEKHNIRGFTLGLESVAEKLRYLSFFSFMKLQVANAPCKKADV